MFKVAPKLSTLSFALLVLGIVGCVPNITEGPPNISDTPLGITQESSTNAKAFSSAGLNPEIFLGKTSDDLVSNLGQEDYRRIDQDVLVLQFRMPNCIIDFVMSSEKRISSYHGRHRVYGQDYDEASCQLDLAARHNGV